MSLHQLLEERDCTEQCKSVQHAKLLCAALTKRQVSDLDLCSYLQYVCCCCESVKDRLGRTTLHMAASCGRADVVKWLIRKRHANINAKDYESGYTPLHRSIFYGKLNVAVHLIKLGANIALTDLNGLTSLDHAMEDSLRSSYLSNEGEVYVWGSNTNYTLGPLQTRTTPDLLVAYHRRHPNLCVQQICLEKFHCVLVSVDGRVFVCGHGQGGRLGLSKEETVMAPEEVKLEVGSQPADVCKKASIAVDHSVFLTETGRIWTCGLNTHRVLGIQPPPEKILKPYPLPLMHYPIKDICAAKYHTVAWCSKAIYTWGLHGGQLGHDKTNEKYIISPKIVTCLFASESTIIAVAASDGATAVVTSKGDIYVLHEYQCRKIASKQLDIISVSIVGGRLNDKIDNSLSAEAHHELIVVGLSKVGNLYLWKEADPAFSRCIFSINRFLKIRQVFLNLNEILLVTTQGEAFQGVLKPKRKKTHELNVNVTKSAFHKFLEKDNCQLLKISRIPRVHRAVSIHSDLKGRNYAVLQAHPKTLLTRLPEVGQSSMQDDMRTFLQETSENDQIYDAIFKVSKRLFLVHHYIIANASSKLSDLITASQDKLIEPLSNNEDIFEQLLMFIYTGTCDLLQPGKCPEKLQLISKKNKNEEVLREQAATEDTNISAFEYYKNEKIKKKISSINANNKDPVRMLHEASKRFGVKSLQSALDNIYYDDGYIVMKKETKLHLSIYRRFDRTQFLQLQDAVIKTKDGKEIKVHKCILSARLEFFNNLFSSRWNSENSSKKEILLPFPQRVVNNLIDFLYTDDLPFLDNADIDEICNLLILADQLFVLRLKEFCGLTLSKLITLKNVVQMFLFAFNYNVDQLKDFCMEFICLNLAAILESKSLECLDDDLLNDLSRFYCDYNSVMQQRIITPYSYAPSDEIVSTAGNINPIVVDYNDSDNDIKTTPRAQKKRLRSRKNISSEYKKERCMSNSLEILDEINIKDKAEKIDNDKTINEETNALSAVQARLKAITIAQHKVDCDTITTNYTKLPLRSNATDVSLDDFPELNNYNSHGWYSKSPNSKDKMDVKYKITKLSQKQRKRLSSESSLSGMETCSPTIAESPKNPWKIHTEMTNVTSVGALPFPATMDSIITDEKRQKENLVKMKTKLLVHTQIEDKAIEDLLKFYNVESVFDEIVTINRVQMGSVASPVWVHLNKSK